MKAIHVSRQPAPARPTVDPGQRPITAAMSSPVLCVRVETLLGDALRTMVNAGRRHLVVIDDAGRCVGVLADRALVATWAQDPGALTRDPVTAAVDPLATIGIGARVVDTARMMRAAGDDAVAVVDENYRPVGIITGSDLITLLAG
jgi:CBS domain-containing protein